MNRCKISKSNSKEVKILIDYIKSFGWIKLCKYDELKSDFKQFAVNKSIKNLNNYMECVR